MNLGHFWDEFINTFGTILGYFWDDFWDTFVMNLGHFRDEFIFIKNIEHVNCSDLILQIFSSEFFYY